jgi:hypothetical protein
MFGATAWRRLELDQDQGILSSGHPGRASEAI